MFTFKVKEKPLWYQFRWRLSNALMGVARWVKPDNPEVMAFLMEVATEQAIMGSALVKFPWGED